MEGMCCVDGCDQKQNSDQSVLFHKFPKNGALKRCWLESIPMKKDIPKTLLVCSDHFIESDYKHVRGKKILNLDNTPTLFTKISKDPDKTDNNKVAQADDEASLKRKGVEDDDITSRILTKISEDPERNDDKVVESDMLTFTNISKDPGKSDNNKEGQSDDEASLKRKSEKDDFTPKIFAKISDDPERSDDKVVESDDETLLKLKTKRDVDNTPAFTNISKDPDKINDTVVESDDEAPLKRISKNYVHNALTKLCEDPDKSDYEQKAHLKRKSRKRNKADKNKCKKKSDDLRPSDSSKNDIDNFNRISEFVNIEVKKGDFHNLDLEDNIPSFIIKDNKPREMIEIHLPPREVEIAPQSTEVVNIEVSVDPTLLMMDETSVVEEIELSGDSDIEITGIENKSIPTDPVSLLTSSDEDEVIYLAPKYDTVEVSDETDEEDRPLIRFINKKPTQKQKYPCSKCEFKTHNHMKFIKHLRKHSIYMCSVCGQTIKGKNQFNSHTRKHDMDKKYKCHLCSYRAKYQMSLYLHVSTHKNYLRCKACPFTTWDHNILSSHRETHLLK